MILIIIIMILFENFFTLAIAGGLSVFLFDSSL